MAAGYCLRSTFPTATVSKVFVGRHREREILKSVIRADDTQLVQLYGLPFAGKTTLIKTVCEELKEEIQPERLHTKHIHISPDTPWSAIHNMYHTFTSSVSFTNTRWKMCIFDDFHNITDGLLTNFQQLCDNDFPQHTNLKVILILNGGKPHEFDGISFSQCKVDPLSMEEAEVIFCRYSGIAVDKQNKPQINKLIRYSCGLPGVLIHLTNRVSQFCPNFSLKDIVNMICDEDSISDWLQDCSVNRRNVKTEIDKYFSKLSPKQQNAIKLLSYFPGRFGIQEATEMIDSASQPSSKVNVLMPLVEQGLINSDFDMESFQVQELMRAIALQQIDNVSSNDLVKLKFTKIIGNCLLKAQGFYEKGLTMEALGILNNNWENIANVMKKGIDPPSDGKTFLVYYNIAENASQLLRVCYPQDSKQFLRACLDNAILFGNEQEQAYMNVSYGVALTNYPGCEGYQTAVSHYDKAMNVFKCQGLTYRQLLLYNSMAYNYHMQHRYKESLQLAEAGYNLAVTDASPQKVKWVKINSASIMSYNLSLIGHYDRCDRLLQENLGQIPAHHPSLAIMLNTRALNYDRRGKHSDEAFLFYNASITERMKVFAINPKLAVIPYCGAAGVLSRDRGDHEAALKLLYKSLAIQKRHGYQHLNTSHVLNNIGLVYLRMKRCSESLKWFHESLSIFNKIIPNHPLKIKVLVLIGHCHLVQESYVIAEKYFQEALLVNHCKGPHTHIDQVKHLSFALEHLFCLKFHNATDQWKILKDLLKQISDLNRLSVNITQSLKYSEASSKYHELQGKLLERFKRPGIETGIVTIEEPLPILCICCSNLKLLWKPSEWRDFTYKLCGLRLSSCNSAELKI
ncbi:uncharacterized protein LOC115223562 [Argonauta hians]